MGFMMKIPEGARIAGLSPVTLNATSNYGMNIEEV